MSVSVKLPVFEGPLDLLLHLIDKNKVDIYQIPIVEITGQYLEIVNEMQQSDMNDISEFLIMAATLLEIKSRMLLPKESSEEEMEETDPRAELVQRLLEYKMYRHMSQELREQSERTGDVLYHAERLPEAVANYVPPVDTGKLLEGVTLDRLEEIFRMISKRQTGKVDYEHRRFGKIEKETVTVEEMITWVANALKEDPSLTFRGLLMAQKTRFRLISAFVAVLELMKNGTVFLEEIEGDADDYRFVLPPDQNREEEPEHGKLGSDY